MECKNLVNFLPTKNQMFRMGETEVFSYPYFILLFSFFNAVHLFERKSINIKMIYIHNLKEETG